MRAGLRALISDADIQIAGEATRLDSIDTTQIEADVLIYASASASSLDASTFDFDRLQMTHRSAQAFCLIPFHLLLF